MQLRTQKELFGSLSSLLLRSETVFNMLLHCFIDFQSHYR